ncbi:transcriptional regulator with XRE-family HTH domain [Kibdelosporangium banguiense]|uniref:Transcriptional regulator with XRE-family HTH domain n=1 Tax=Kibdelosporangium banguiense TaxID=1365924 RepID=A0ABS4TFS1_9PSEU|nr:helix-turn-helix transcriptional regulator [Kibdelosporangium banguiense]MBP2323266.1 transcriptional regulator with XRE-family HTH domain [Kibdelosporangium banguiense]
MTEPARPIFVRRKLGAKLRRLRERAELTLADAAPRLDRTKSALHRVETGETKADVHLVRTMMDIYDCFDPNLLDEARHALKPPWYRAYGVKDKGYVDVETEAEEVNQVQLVGIPGLLQTKAYTRALFHVGRSRSPEELDCDVKVRGIRQLRLTSEERPLQLVAVVHEAALRRVVGGRRVMREQMRHLVKAAALPTVTLQVIPLDEGSYMVPYGPFNLLRFPDPEDPELLYIEHPGGAHHIEEAPKVREGRLVFDQLRIHALSPTDSVALIERLATELYGPRQVRHARGPLRTDLAEEHL